MERRKSLTRLATLISISLFIFIWGLFPNFVLSTYVKVVYPYISITLRWLSSIFPFAIGDLLYALLIIYIFFLIVKFFWRLKQTGWIKADRIQVPIAIINKFLIFYISFKLLWGLNYSRPSITTQLNISYEKYTIKELVILGNYFVNKTNQTRPLISSNLSYNISYLREKSILAFQKSAKDNLFFNYKAPAVKSVINAFVISKIGIEGYYNPFSGEANVNMKLPPWILPFVACHEIAHQLGVAREDEANLVAYLVGKNSHDIDLQYSVNYNMLRYILFEISIKSPEDYIAMRDKISLEVLADFKKENEFWVKYNGDMSNYMNVTFDKFLKFNNQESGIESYQNIVVWLWNIHKDELIPLAP